MIPIHCILIFMGIICQTEPDRGTIQGDNDFYLLWVSIAQAEEKIHRFQVSLTIRRAKCMIYICIQDMQHNNIRDFCHGLLLKNGIHSD